MTEQESAHGKLSPVDQQWTGPRFIGLLFVSLLIALAVIYFIASVKSGDYSWSPLAHDPIEHVF